MGNPLGSEALYFLDGVMGCVEEELADQMEAFIVRYMSCGLLGECFAIEVLME